jgi:hypothetical protein
MLSTPTEGYNVHVQLQIFFEMFCQLQPHFPKAPILNLTDLPKLFMDTAIFFL